jgi:addiction module HigA family antidote
MKASNAHHEHLAGTPTARCPFLEDHVMLKNRMRAIHPGEVLREEYLRPLCMSASALAKALNVGPSTITGLVGERRRMTASTALRLARYFGGNESDALGWLYLQGVYDLKKTRATEAKRISKEVEPRDELFRQDASWPGTENGMPRRPGRR